MLNRLSRYVFLLILCLPAASYAWNDVGHMTIAEIAWQKLSPEDRAAVSAILKAHPSYTTYLTADLPTGVSADEWAFLRASTWPDWVRSSRPGDKQFKDATITRYHHGPWHYINLPFTLEGAPPAATQPSTQPAKDFDVVSAIDANRADLKSVTKTALDRAIALSWVEHLVGDVHQPLHATTLYSKQYPEGDKGGNDQAILTASGVMNLHSLWDEMLGTMPNYRMVEFLADDISADPRCDPTKQRDYATHSTPVTWASESHDDAVAFAYLEGRLKTVPMKESKSSDVPTVPPMYLENARDVARVRVAMAGARLAEMIHAVLAK